MDPLFDYSEAAKYLTEATGTAVTPRMVRNLADKHELATERLPGRPLTGKIRYRGIRKSVLDEHIRRARTMNGGDPQ